MPSEIKNDHNAVLCANDQVIKILKGSSRFRRFNSEIITRNLLGKTIQYIPIIESAPIATAIVMPFASEALAGILESELDRFIELSIILLRRQSVPTGFGYGWLGDMANVHSSLELFIAAYVSGILSTRPGDKLFLKTQTWISTKTATITKSVPAVLCLGDISPKNCYLNEKGIVLFDFETTISGTPELEATRFAINLIIHNKSLLDEALRVIGSLSLNTESANVSLAFNLVRYIVYGRRYGMDTVGLEAALSTVASGGSLVQAIREI